MLTLDINKCSNVNKWQGFWSFLHGSVSIEESEQINGEREKEKEREIKGEKENRINKIPNVHKKSSTTV